MPVRPFTFNLCCLLLLFSGITLAQAPRNGAIAGKVRDMSNKRPLDAVTVSAVLVKDSVLINYVSTNAEGRYRLTGLPVGKPFEVFVTRKGYRDTFAVFILTTDKPVLDSLDWLMAVQPIELKGVSIVASRAPFSYRNDTLEFNATAYKVKPNGTIRELLAKLPGVQIDESGQITVFGKKVDKIQLEGDEFYGDNLNGSIENLPANIIEKIQVTPSKTELDKLTPGPKKRSQNMTINLTLKKDKKQGFLGNMGIAGGTDGRYAGDIATNRLGGEFRMNAQANAGNVSRDAAMRGMDQGITEYRSGAISMGRKVGEKVRLGMDYSGNKRSTSQSEETERVNFLPDSSFTNSSSSRSKSSTGGHNISGNLAYTADSLSQLHLVMSGSWFNSSNSSASQSAARSEEGLLINTMDSRQSGAGTGQTFSIGAGYRRVTRNRKGFVNVQYGVSLNTGNNNNRQYTINTFLKAPADTIDQRSVDESHGQTQNLGIEISYSLAKNISFSAGYGFNYNGNRQRREVFNPVDGKYTARDSVLSAYNKMENISHVPRFSLGFRNDKFGVTLNGGWSITSQRSRFLWQDSSVIVKQQQFSPSVNADYNFSWGNLSASYAVSGSAPSPSYLSPVVDNRNPLSIVIGNPSLKNTLDHSGSVNLSLYKPTSGIGADFALDGSLSQNQVVADISYDSLRRQVTRYRNTNGIGNIQLKGGLNAMKMVAKWMLRSGVNGNVSRSVDVGYLDGKRNEAGRWAVRGGISGGAGHSEWFNFHSYLNLSWSRSVNSLGGLNNNETTSLIYSSVLETSAIKKMSASVNYNYRQNNQLPADMGRRIHQVSARVERRFLKKENLTLSLSANDLFNNGNIVSRRVTASYVENRTGNALGRYFMMRLQWNFDGLHEERVAVF